MLSTRLPGKVLKPINGISVLDYLITRIKNVSYIDEYFEAENEFLNSARKVKKHLAEPVFDDESLRVSYLDNNEVDALTISQAKAGLSIHYDIPEENIEIILKG